MGLRGFGGRVAVAAVAAVMATACTAGDDSASDTSVDDTEPGSSVPVATGPAPGVTDDAIQIGVTYGDLEALAAIGLDFDAGPAEDVYSALAADINDAGGINGRQIELTFAPVDVVQPSPGEAECVELTEDADVFAVMGFFLGDAVLCPVATHETAVIGGEQSPARMEQAVAPWATWTPDADLAEDALRAYDEMGALDGTVAVFVNARDQGILDEHVVPTLEELGVEPVEVGVVDAPANDQVALGTNVDTIAERFEASGADTVVVVGLSGSDWPTQMSDNPDYRPQLLFLDVQAPRAFLNTSGDTDTSVLDGSLAAGTYGPFQDAFDEPAMQECVGRLADRGIDTPSPDSTSGEPGDLPFNAAFAGCADFALLQAWFEAAGEDLNYGTLQSALDAGFDLAIPGDPTERQYGAAPDADGDPPAYLFEWDPDAQDFARID